MIGDDLSACFQVKLGHNDRGSVEIRFKIMTQLSGLADLFVLVPNLRVPKLGARALFFFGKIGIEPWQHYGELMDGLLTKIRTPQPSESFLVDMHVADILMFSHGKKHFKRIFRPVFRGGGVFVVGLRGKGSARI